MDRLDLGGRTLAAARLGPQKSPGLLALRHALEFDRPGLWVDDPAHPRSIALLRGGDDGPDAFADGRPDEAVRWLRGLGRPVTLHAPARWVAALGEARRFEVETWAGPPGIAPRDAASARRLGLADATAFHAVAPAWALRGWGTFEDMTRRSAGFGVDGGGGLAAAAWGLDRAGRYESVGVAVDPRYRRLGLGRAAASAMIGWILGRGRSPTWSVAPGNLPSRGLARALGLRRRSVESIWRLG